jgi:hypothetical protein
MFKEQEVYLEGDRFQSRLKYRLSVDGLVTTCGKSKEICIYKRTSQNDCSSQESRDNQYACI